MWNSKICLQTIILMLTSISEEGWLEMRLNLNSKFCSWKDRSKSSGQDFVEQTKESHSGNYPINPWKKQEILILWENIIKINSILNACILNTKTLIENWYNPIIYFTYFLVFTILLNNNKNSFIFFALWVIYLGLH